MLKGKAYSLEYTLPFMSRFTVYPAELVCLSVPQSPVHLFAQIAGQIPAFSVAFLEVNTGIVVPGEGPVGGPYQNGIRMLEEAYDIKDSLHASSTTADDTKTAYLPIKEFRSSLPHLGKTLKQCYHDGTQTGISDVARDNEPISLFKFFFPLVDGILLYTLAAFSATSTSGTMQRGLFSNKNHFRVVLFFL